MTTIVTIDPDRFDNPIHQGMYVLGELRSAGVPVVGVLGVTGVEVGSLTISEPDIVDGCVLYLWSES